MITAIHEAGHAVAAYQLGYTPTLVTIRARGESRRCTHYRRVRIHPNEDTASQRRKAEHAIMIAYAGLIAECCFRTYGISEGNQEPWTSWYGDIEKIEAYLDEIQELYSMSDENKEALGQDIMKRSEDLVAANFWKILQVKELLMERRRIDGEDITGIIELMPDGPVTQEDAA
jgi:ATP-dependent Zn protease